MQPSNQPPKSNHPSNTNANNTNTNSNSNHTSMPPLPLLTLEARRRQFNELQRLLREFTSARAELAHRLDDFAMRVSAPGMGDQDMDLIEECYEVLGPAAHLPALGGGFQGALGAYAGLRVPNVNIAAALARGGRGLSGYTGDRSAGSSPNTLSSSSSTTSRPHEGSHRRHRATYSGTPPAEVEIKEEELEDEGGHIGRRAAEQNVQGHAAQFASLTPDTPQPYRLRGRSTGLLTGPLLWNPHAQHQATSRFRDEDEDRVKLEHTTPPLSYIPHIPHSSPENPHPDPYSPSSFGTPESPLSLAVERRRSNMLKRARNSAENEDESEEGEFGRPAVRRRMGEGNVDVDDREPGPSRRASPPTPTPTRMQTRTRTQTRTQARRLRSQAPSPPAQRPWQQLILNPVTPPSSPYRGSATSATQPPTASVPPPQPSTSTSIPLPLPQPSTSIVPPQPSTSTVPPQPSTSTLPPQPSTSAQPASTRRSTTIHFTQVTPPIYSRRPGPSTSSQQPARSGPSQQPNSFAPVERGILKRARNSEDDEDEQHRPNQRVRFGDYSGSNGDDGEEQTMGRGMVARRTRPLDNVSRRVRMGVQGRTQELIAQTHPTPPPAPARHAGQAGQAHGPAPALPPAPQPLVRRLRHDSFGRIEVAVRRSERLKKQK